MPSPSKAHACLLALLACGACQSLVQLDVDCPELCMSSEGPTLPGLDRFGSTTSYGVGGGLDAGMAGLMDTAAAAPASVSTIRWDTMLAFDEVLAQLPSQAISLSADVRLHSVTLSSTNTLDFIASAEVTLGEGPGSTGLLASPSSYPSAISTPDAGPGNPCTTSGTTARVAHFQRAEGSPSGTILPLTLESPSLNLWDCVSDRPLQLHAQLTPTLAMLPANDTPLTLATCIRSRTQAAYP